MSLLSPEELTLLHTDNKYKAYVSSIEKCLKNFESSSEWADLISSLGKLKKVVHSSPKYQYIPKRVNVCKRLAQCLHPALPSGVHLKALEVYTCIFQNIGAENLAKDLFLYSSGLFPLLANAALSVKPVLLNLYETYFLPLKKSLRPGLTGLLIALFPGLEEGSDFYQRTFNLIKNICLVQSDSSANVTNMNNYIADDKYFHSCIWSAIISESYIRFPAIQFMLSNYELKKRSGSVNANDQLYLIGNSIDLMTNAICCCLQDANSLVQRSILDLICTCLPMNTKNVTRSDKIQLITVAIHVVLRRDMTLNRRIYSWLMGNGSNSEESKKNDKNYFELHSKSILVQSIKMLLNKKEASSILYLLNDETPAVASQAGTITHSGQNPQISPSAATTLKLIKIISNLVERQDIGQAIIDDILLDLLFYVYKEYSFLNLNNGPASSNVQSYLSIKKGTSNFQHVQQQQQQNQNLKDSNELKKATCNFLFHSFQIFFIWDFCASKFESICRNFTSSTRLESASSHTITSDNVHSSTLNPAQLCDLYEFILELLANSDMYNEIQTEHLPVMLKRIIQTITNYCDKMTNQDLSKSFLLCLKILNKVVPKISVPESNLSTSARSRKLSTKKPPVEENQPDLVEEIVKQVMDDLIANVECTEPLSEPCTITISVQSTDQETDDKLLMIEQCLSSLKKLTHTFVHSHMFNEDQLDQVDKSFKSLFSKSSFSNDDGYLCDSHMNNLCHIKLKSSSLHYLQSYQILNKLLIKMLFFPREQQSGGKWSGDDDTTEWCVVNSFEEWLKDLFVIACCSQMPNRKQLFELQSVSLNTLIELIHLSESINCHFNKRSHTDPKCLLQTIFSPAQVDLVFTGSKFGHVTAQMLWSHLCPAPSQLEPMLNCTDKRASILFCLLHELLPSNLCEEIVIKHFLCSSSCMATSASDLYTTCNLKAKMDSFGRFTRLWHWSRELNSNKDLDQIEELSVSTIKYGKLTKTFDKFLLILFDHLAREDTPSSLHMLIQDWLASSITDYHDLARLIDVLLVSLVHPSTARISVQHFVPKLLNADAAKSGLADQISDNSSTYESKVYAISNEDGNVKYHVNNTDKPSSQQHHHQQHQQQQQMFVLTSLDQSSQSNRPLRNANIELPLSILNASSLNSAISLRINPFLDDDETEEENSSKNGRLLENYKAAKLKQSSSSSKNGSQVASPNVSPSLTSLSANPADQSIQSIGQSNRNSMETEYLSDEEEQDHDDEDVDDEDELDDDDDYETFGASDLEFNQHSESHGTDLTLLNGREKKSRNSFGKKGRKLRIKEKLKKSSSSTLIRAKSSEKLGQSLLLKSKDLLVDLEAGVEPAHAHLLVYTNCANLQPIQQGNCVLVVSKYSNTSYDHVKVLFALKCIEQLLLKCKSDFLFCVSQSTLSDQKLVHSVHNQKLIDLIVKHLSSVHGENFYLSSKNVTSMTVSSMTYLEAVSLVLLFYIRSYYPCSRFVVKNAGEQIGKWCKSSSVQSASSEVAAVADESDALSQFEENRNIQIYCLKVMGQIFKELGSLMSLSSKQIHRHVADYLDKLKIQKTFLHLFHCSTEEPAPNGLANLLLRQNSKQSQRCYVAELLNCFQSLIDLEKVLADYNLKFVKTGLLTSASHKTTDPEVDELLLDLKHACSLPHTAKYIPSQTIFNQSMFVSSVLYYLKNMGLVEYHLDILKLIRNTLASTGSSLKSITTYIIEQLCRNLMYITNGGMNTSGSSSSNYIQPLLSYMSQVSLAINIPDIVIDMIKQLAFILNYCLISGQNVNSVVFNFGTENPESQSKLFRQFQTDNELNQIHARESLIHLFPSILSSMVQVWQRCNLLLNSHVPASLDSSNSTIVNQIHCSWILGHPAVIKQCITDLLNPIAQFNKVQLMHAIGTVWGERRKKSRLLQEHRVIIELIRSLKSFPLSVIILNIIEILKQSGSGNTKEKKKSPLNIWLLQFLHTYLDNYLGSIKTPSKYNHFQTEQLSQNDLAACLCNFFKEVLTNSTTSNFAPACYFQLFRILHDSVNNFSILVDDKKYSKDIQEATHKLFELCNSIVASSLQQTTWLRKNFAVKLNPQPELKSQSSSSQLNQANTNGPSNSTNSSLLQPNSANLSESSNLNSKSIASGTTNGIGSNSSVSNPRSNFSDLENEMTSNLSDHGSNLNSMDPMNALIGDLNDSNNNLAYSLQALNILAEFLAKTLDIVYKSDEKDRLVIPILISLMSNLWPYLKTHLVANKNNFKAASHLLMTLTVYPYTRKTWKKEVYEMLFDNMYFHVDSATLEYSKIIIDNLISNDRAMFKDVLTRVTYQQSGGLFTSKEQESEQKAQLLKRLAFVIFSSEKDQYQRNMPEIQECIAHVLKLVQSANLYSTLFLLFRILFLRISSKHLTALWPTIITELVLILLQIEQDLSEEQELKNGTKYSNLDHIASQMSTQNWNNSKLHIYLSACKFIDLILTLPSPLTPQFQLYKWSFINTDDTINFNHRDQFIPYLNKINHLLKVKYPNSKSVNLRSSPNGPLLRYKRISSLVDLKAFFEQVTAHQFVHSSNQTHIITSQQLQSSLLTTTNLKQFEASVHEDFLEGWIQ